MGLSEEIRQRLINSFKTEQSEHIQKINQGLLALEKDPHAPDQQARLNEIFREAHSLKGAARAVGLTTVEALSHALEELLLQAKEGRLAFSPPLFDLLYQALDAIEAITARVEAGEASPSPEVIALLARLSEAINQGPGSRGQGAGAREQGPAKRPRQAKNKKQGDHQDIAGQSPSLVTALEVNRPQEPINETADRSQPEQVVSSQFSPSSAGPASLQTPPPDPPTLDTLPAVATGGGGRAGRSLAPDSQSEETIRVSVAKLDALMAQFSELLGAKIRAEQRLAEVRQMQAFAAEWQKDWLDLRTTYNRLTRSGQRPFDRNGHRQSGGVQTMLRHETARADTYRLPPALTGFETAPSALLPALPQPDTTGQDGLANSPALAKDLATLLNFVSQNQERLHALNSQSNTLYRELANDTLRLSLIIDELQEEIKRVRMLPLATITPTFGRMVRDLAREQNKQISLTIDGGDTELDKRVLEQIKDPLIHLLRNAVDHGLETTTARQQAGKPAEGHITLSASQQGNNVVITVTDDGQGLDLRAIRQAVARRGLMPLAEVEKLSDADTAGLIFTSGLSTSKIITDISGRGVGLDVVRQNVEELHGTLEVSFVEGQGTTFTMTLPLTLASSRGLMVRAGGQVFVLPLSTVERMLEVDRAAIATVEGRLAINYLGKPVALARLVDLLELPTTAPEPDGVMVVIITVADKRLGLIVDSLEGEQEIVIKSLGKQLTKVSGIAGATVLGSGQVILVLHAADLVKLATRTQSAAPGQPNTPVSQQAPQHKAILVVDDSITTRTLEKNILEAAGYQVWLATDGEEALGILATDGLPHLIISDINMPRLDGFELTERVKNDNRYTGVPVILVTSLDSPADKARGIEVGADAYIVKSSFDQGNLLETIEQLV